MWDITPKTSFTVDLWQIKRKGEINQETSAAAIAAGHVSRDPSTASPGFPGDPGAITAVLDQLHQLRPVHQVRGIDFDVQPSHGPGQRQGQG